ncbi:MAG TPA: hypothetical protein VF942_11670 [Acidimicrobiales bacterium]
MLPRDRAGKIITLSQAGWPVKDIAGQLGHAPQTIRDYLSGDRTPGVRAPRPSLLTDPLVNYCRRRFVEDPHLRPASLFKELTELGFRGSRSTFYRELTQRQLAPPEDRQSDTRDNLPEVVTRLADRLDRSSALPRPAAPITGETLVSYLTRLADANRLTLAEMLAVLPSWFTTKTSNRDDRARHHMLAPATSEALNSLARLAGTTPAGLAHALPAFGAADTDNPLRATVACHKCTAHRGVHEPIPVHLPVHHKVCTRHGVWLGDPGLPHLDVTACPEIITAQYRAKRLLRRYASHQLTLALVAVTSTIPAWPASPDAIPLHWRHRLLILQTTNHSRDIPTDPEIYTNAAIYPDAIALAAAILNPGHSRIIKQTPSADTLECRG